MNMKKLAIAAAVSAAVGGATMPAQAIITGVPGEALLVPLVLKGESGSYVETYVGISVPEALGHDTVIKNFTAPNLLDGFDTLAGPYFQGTDPTVNWEIHWSLFNYRSIEQDNEECSVSRGDAVLWTTDEQALLRQEQIRSALGWLAPGEGIPSPVCGTDTESYRIGYAVFQSYSAAGGNAPDFAMAGAAGIVAQSGLLATGPTAMASVPVLPMADGEDTADEVPGLGNEVIVTTPFSPIDANPIAEVAPIAAGIRMHDNVDNGTRFVRIEMPIQGPGSATSASSTTDNTGMSYHVMWFDSNNRNDTADGTPYDIFDEHQDECSGYVDLNNEVNILAYNLYLTGITGNGWSQLAGGFNNNAGAETRGLTDVIDATHGNSSSNQYNSEEFCDTDYWQYSSVSSPTYLGSMGGYARYKLAEEKEDASDADGKVVTSAAVAFNLQENFNAAPGGAPGTSAFSSHLGIDMGIH